MTSALRFFYTHHDCLKEPGELEATNAIMEELQQWLDAKIKQHADDLEKLHISLQQNPAMPFKDAPDKQNKKPWGTTLQFKYFLLLYTPKYSYVT